MLVLQSNKYFLGRYFVLNFVGVTTQNLIERFVHQDPVDHLFEFGLGELDDRFIAGGNLLTSLAACLPTDTTS